MPTITRIHGFDYGHKVWGHEGKCRNVHGHRGAAEITVQAVGLDSIGRVIDFSKVKEIIGGWIDKNWDHSFLVNKNDPLVQLYQNCASPSDVFGKEFFIMPEGNPTAELMAKHLFEVCQLLLPHGIEVVNIRLWETPNSYADYNGQ